MKVSCNGFVPFTEEDVSRVELYIGSSLCESLKAFYSAYNGMRIQVNEVLAVPEGDVCITQFVSVQSVISELEMVEFGRKVLPIAWAEGGNYVVCDLSDGLIYFLDHEILDGYRLLAKGIPDLIDKLVPAKPFVKPGNFKVKEVWIDPEFLKRIRSGEFE